MSDVSENVVLWMLKQHSLEKLHTLHLIHALLCEKIHMKV